MVPKNRPAWPATKVREILAKHGVTEVPAILAVRGYFQDSMGKIGMNDRNLYDDAIFFAANGFVKSFNANTDPSVFRKGVAKLINGVWRFEKGLHGISRPKPYVPYPALRQGEKFTVHRDGTGNDSGFFGINIHRGGSSTTSSLGCLTIPPDQWPGFIKLAYDELAKAKKTSLRLVLIEGQG